MLRLGRRFGGMRMAGWGCCLALRCRSLWGLGGRGAGLVSRLLRLWKRKMLLLLLLLLSSQLLVVVPAGCRRLQPPLHKNLSPRRKRPS
jgi:hypothetical protein